MAKKNIDLHSKELPIIVHNDVVSIKVSDIRKKNLIVWCIRVLSDAEEKSALIPFDEVIDVAGLKRTSRPSEVALFLRGFIKTIRKELNMNYLLKGVSTFLPLFNVLHFNKRDKTLEVSMTTELTYLNNQLYSNYCSFPYDEAFKGTRYAQRLMYAIVSRRLISNVKFTSEEMLEILDVKSGHPSALKNRYIKPSMYALSKDFLDLELICTGYGANREYLFSWSYQGQKDKQIEEKNSRMLKASKYKAKNTAPVVSTEEKIEDSSKKEEEDESNIDLLLPPCDERYFYWDDPDLFSQYSMDKEDYIYSLSDAGIQVFMLKSKRIKKERALLAKEQEKINGKAVAQPEPDKEEPKAPVVESKALFDDETVELLEARICSGNY